MKSDKDDSQGMVGWIVHWIIPPKTEVCVRIVAKSHEWFVFSVYYISKFVYVNNYFLINLTSLCFLRVGLHHTSCFMCFFQSFVFYIFKQVLIHSRFWECCHSVKLQKCFVDYETFDIMTEIQCLGELILSRHFLQFFHGMGMIRTLLRLRSEKDIGYGSFLREY